MRTRFISIAVSIFVAACGSSGPSTPHEVVEKDPAPAPTQPGPEEALLVPWSGPNGGVPPWDRVTLEALRGAFDKAVAEQRGEVRAIASSPEAPTFDNTIVALERSGATLNRVATLFFVHASNLNTPEVQALTAVIRPKLAEVQDEIHFDAALFDRVAKVYASPEKGSLGPEQQRLTDKTYDDFVQSGARLRPEEKAKVAEINQALAKRFTEFANHVQADEDTFVVLGEGDLAGLPTSLVGTYKAAADERKVAGWVVVNTRSAVDPFLTFSAERALREKVWRAFVNRGDNGADHDTNALISQIVKLRAERAALLGFASHAHWRMADTMAKDPAAAMDLMMRVWPAAKKRVAEEVADMRKLAKKEGAKITIEPWDYRFYMEKVRKQRYDLDQNEFKAYFELENMIKASYYMAEKLFGYAFEEVTGQVPVFHPDVRVYHVTNAADGTHVGYLYRDDFARQYKRSGAWQSTYQTQRKLDGQVDAIVSNNNNFAKGQAGAPVLISLDDAETLFHEFGHALHALSNDTTYASLANTPRDFVEFPSQVHENWLLTREILDRFARHYQTGEAMPQALVDKLRKAATFNQGFATVEYLAAAIIDMKLHTDPSGQVDADAFERDTLAALGMPKEIVLRHRLPHFLHLFSSDAYSAGYYSYLWSDVMAADAWQAFQEAKDPWDPATAKKFKDIILATGDAIDRREAYRQFRGRDPKVEALLKDRGFPTK